MADLLLPDGATVHVVPLYAVSTSETEITVPATPKVVALLESWLKANHYARLEDDTWHAEGLPEPLDFERALGHCATLPA